MQKWKNEFNLCVFVMTLPSLDDKKKITKPLVSQCDRRSDLG